MISRRTTLLLARLYESVFVREVPSTYSFTFTGHRPQPPHITHFAVDSEALFEFLFEHDYESWLCNTAKRLKTSKAVKELVMRLHTGEVQADAKPELTIEQREQLGQRLLRDLAEDILSTIEVIFATLDDEELDKSQHPPVIEALISDRDTLMRSLELDGYIYREKKLWSSEEDVLDVREERGILENLYASLALENAEVAFHHLGLSEEHYVAHRWDDAISNSRKFLELTLQEVAAAYSHRKLKMPLDDRTRKQPYKVRDYLEQEKLLDKQEKEALIAVYGLLSQKGGHPYMAANDQARLLRHLALTFSQFVMLRLEGALKS